MTQSPFGRSEASFRDVSPVEVATVATLLSDVARASMVSILLDGRARTARELAMAAGITPQTASSHLAKLIEGGLLTALPQGRHRYHRLAHPDVAHALEALSILAVSPLRKQRAPGPKDAALREGRTCYDHFAGRLGVAIADALVTTGAMVEEGRNFRMTEAGEGRLSCLGIEVAELRRSRRPICRWCLDWSERRPHLAGAIGARLTSRSLEAGWVRRVDDSRAVRVTPGGERVFADVLGLRLAGVAHAA
jgi:DNA-binding transcriptional ArsR family regulator